MNELKNKTAQKFQNILTEYLPNAKVVEFSESTRTSKEAAEAVGCTLGQIAKSLIFKSAKTQKPILIIASGKNRVDEERVEKYLGEPIEKADAQFVVEKTGFAIGGVPPFGHKNDIVPIIDEDLNKYEVIWAAAGTPHAVFQLTPKDLISIANGQVVRVKK